MQSTRTCTFDGCERLSHAMGLCDGHYRQRRNGRDLRPLRPNGVGVALRQRFWSKVDKSAFGGCWNWTGSTNGGYGHIRIGGQLLKAHRVSWKFVNGAIPPDAMIDHRCANRRCVNPGHLRLVTDSQNQQHLTGAQVNSASGVRGVYWCTQRNTWRVQVKLNKRKYFGGYYSSLERAEDAAKSLRARIFTHDDHYEWAETQVSEA